MRKRCRRWCFFCRVTTPASKTASAIKEKQGECCKLIFGVSGGGNLSTSHVAVVVVVVCEASAPGVRRPPRFLLQHIQIMDHVPERARQGASTATRRVIALKTRRAASESGLKKGARSLCVERMGIHISQGANFASARAGYRINDDGRTDGRTALTFEVRPT